jgi:hypothetical protein
MHDPRNSSASSRVTIERATTIPPTHNAAIARARICLGLFLSTKLRSNTPTIALKTVSNALFALSPLRATSLGIATIGQEFSTSS